MIGVILAGGRGTRMNEAFPDIPKVLLPINGRAVIYHTVDQLIKQSITEIIIILGYEAEKIRSSLISEYGDVVDLQFICEEDALGSGGIFYQHTWNNDSQYFIALGDVYFDISVSRLKLALEQNDCDGYVFTHANDHPFDSDLVISCRDKRITGIINKNDPKLDYFSNAVIAGIYIISGRALNKLKGKRVVADLSQDVISDLVQLGFDLYEYETTEYIKDMGTPDRLQKVNAHVDLKIPNKRNLDNKQMAVFLDRDGVINEECGHISQWRDLKLKNGVANFIRKLNKAGILAICVTNQPVIARGEIDEASFVGTVMGRLDFLLSSEGAYLDDFFYCPHHPDSGFPGEVRELKVRCACRKPEAGMLFGARDKWNIDEKVSWMIGDREVDIAAGKKFGCKTILVTDSDTHFNNHEADFLALGIDEASDYIFRFNEAN
jgi:mannose-1-phosphate guanylyltransferase/phosphomannomutase